MSSMGIGGDNYLIPFEYPQFFSSMPTLGTSPLLLCRYKQKNESL